jgi:Fe-S cluster biogenesis protein NfuA
MVRHMEKKMSASADFSDLRDRVASVLAAEIQPVLQMDGGDIEVVDVNDGIVRLRLHGTCGGCPSVIMAVIMEIEQELRKRIAEVEYLEVIP